MTRLFSPPCVLGCVAGFVDVCKLAVYRRPHQQCRSQLCCRLRKLNFLRQTLRRQRQTNGRFTRSKQHSESTPKLRCPPVVCQVCTESGCCKFQSQPADDASTQAEHQRRCTRRSTSVTGATFTTTRTESTLALAAANIAMRQTLTARACSASVCHATPLAATGGLYCVARAWWRGPNCQGPEWIHATIGM